MAWAPPLTCSGTASVDALVADLSAREDSNFRLFGYVGEVNADTEILQERQRSLQVSTNKSSAQRVALYTYVGADDAQLPCLPQTSCELPDAYSRLLACSALPSAVP